MTPVRVAIVADDLTGALDVCAPFARRGLQCRVAVTPQGLDHALAQDAQVVCVNTASRELESEAAATRVSQAAQRMARVRPDIAFKKIDSRLKGHVAVEVEACLAAFELEHALVAPAVPAQGRFVQAGRIVGRGVGEPIDIASQLGNNLPLTVGDGNSPEDMEQLARDHAPHDLLVGASGLGDGLARLLTEQAPAPLIAAPLPMLVAIGSHDPVTLAQIERLRYVPGINWLETADGLIGSELDASEVTLVHVVSQPHGSEHSAVLARFGLAIADQLRSDRFASTLLCGGETAQTVLNALEIDSLELAGEALPGIPVSQAQRAGLTLTILTKSGGFGTSEDLFQIAEAARSVEPSSDPNRAGIPA